MMRNYCVRIFFLLIPIYAQGVAPNTVIATMTAGVNASGLAITPDGTRAYVANDNCYGVMFAEPMATSANTVTVLDLTNNTVITTISDASFNQPYTVTINKAGTLAYVTNSNADTVTIINIATNTVSGTITGFDGPSGFVISLDGTKAYVNNYGGPTGVGSGNGTTVRVVDLNTNMITGPAITVDQAPAALAITPDGQFVYVINYVDGNPGTGTVQRIRTSDNTVMAPTITGFSGPFGIAISPNGKFAYVTNFGSNNFTPFGTTMSVIDIATNMIIATVPLGIQPAGVAVTPDNLLIYATNYNTLYAGESFTDLTAGLGTVNIIDAATNKVLPPTIAVHESPGNIAISPNGEFAYVSHYTSNVVDVIALQSFQIVAQGCKTQNVFLNQVDLINRLTWSVSGTSLPVSYSIYRDAELTDLVAMVPANGPLQFLDHNRLPDVVYTYYLVGTNAVGTTSEPIEIIVTQDC